jgi:hypothetical protein
MEPAARSELLASKRNGLTPILLQERREAALAPS